MNSLASFIWFSRTTRRCTCILTHVCVHILQSPRCCQRISTKSRDKYVFFMIIPSTVYAKKEDRSFHKKDRLSFLWKSSRQVVEKILMSLCDCKLLIQYRTPPRSVEKNGLDNFVTAMYTGTVPGVTPDYNSHASQTCFVGIAQENVRSSRFQRCYQEYKKSF